MKILYILNKSVLSGPNIVALTNAEELHKRGCDVTVCFIKYGLDLSLYYPFLEEIKVMYFDGLGYLRGLRAFYNFVKKENFQIIHSHCFLPDIANVVTKFFIKRGHSKHVNTVHNIPAQDYTIRYGIVKGRILLFIHNILFSLLDISICISKTVQKSVGNEHSHVIHNPVRNDFFNLSKKINTSLKIVYCGHFSELKKTNVIIDSLSKIDGEFQFIGLGDGPLLQECRDLVSNDKRFIFTGRVDNVADYYVDANCLIHFSQTEGFCLSVAEALAAKMYVITNNLPVFHELKNMLNAENFIIINEFDERNLKFALNKVFQNIVAENTICFDIAKKTEGKLAPNITAVEHLKLYEKLLKSDFRV